MNHEPHFAALLGLLLIAPSLCCLFASTSAFAEDCRAEDIQATLDAAAGMTSVESQKAVTWQGVAYACPGLPDGIQSAAEAFSSVAPDKRAMMVARGLASSLDTVARACGDARSTLEAIGTSSRDEAFGLLVESCQLAALLSEDELAELRRDESTEPLSVLLALTLNAWLHDAGVSESRTLARRMLGFGLPATKQEDELIPFLP
ncbi:MAG: hypothetical protein RBU37_00490 [Myxococcota bacterium]|jgi:hypothetical protein|nr:hypothetical protein [Myxococcota bacterium]